jgi:hypothetical protein
MNGHVTTYRSSRWNILFGHCPQFAFAIAVLVGHPERPRFLQQAGFRASISVFDRYC